MKGKLNIKDHTNLMVGGSGSDLALWAQTNRDYNLAAEESIQWLVENLKVAAVHPDDGWVNREENIIEFAYPKYKEDINVGSLIAIGSHSSGYRIVQATTKIESLFVTEGWHFTKIWPPEESD